MTATVCERDVLAAADALAGDLERRCVSGPFGNGPAIAATAAAYYAGLGKVVADALGIDRGGLAPEPAPQLESLRRASIDEAFTALLRQDADGGRGALAAYCDLRGRFTAADFAADAAGWAAGDGGGFPAVWAGNPVVEELVRRFAVSMTGRPEGDDIRIATPTARQREGCAGAVDLLRRAVPVLAADVLPGAPLLGLFEGDLASAFATAAPLVIFVNASFFDDRYLAAELLQHEALHQKLNDIALARALFRPGYVDAESAPVSVPWAMPGVSLPRYFSADRCFAAFHVYAHQAVLFLGALARCTAPADLPAATDRLVVSYARAEFFARALTEPGIRQEWGPDGFRLAAWLGSIVAPLDDVALPDGSRLREHAGAWAGGS